VHVVPYGVDVPDVPLRRQAGDGVRCLAVGRMIGKKAPLLTLEAFRRASKKCPRLRLDFVGGGQLFPAAVKYVKDHSLQDRVTLHSHQPHDFVRQLLTEADIFLQHSITGPGGAEEGLPVSILEGMAAALPIVSTRHAGIPEAVVEGVTGFLVDEGDFAAMSEHIIELAQNNDLRVKMGRTGWRTAKQRFSWDHERMRLLRVMGLEYAATSYEWQAKAA
jgi:colanic acid/amylovoran biosynthesis glycosyltransferase